MFLLVLMDLPALPVLMAFPVLLDLSALPVLMVLMGHGTVAPQIEALEPEYWGVSWGAGAFDTL